MKQLGKYEVLGELGRGAMGVVYRARDPMINRLVALKTITTGLAEDPDLLERFCREAQSAGCLQHPNIVTVYDMGQADAIPYIAMEMVEGENLERIIARRAALPLTLKLAYALQACRAFEYAHKRGIIHRDIKPANVMVAQDGTVKVVDFGIARVLGSSRTQTGILIGTLAYMSPEQYHGQHADERSDIWSFGVLLYELFSYQRPFTGGNPASLMNSICKEEPTPLNKVLPECPEELEATVSRMLRKVPQERHESMEEVLFDLSLISKTHEAQSIADLLTQARGLLDQQSFSEAREMVRQALERDSGNHQARTLLEKANAGLKRIQNRREAQALVEKGQTRVEAEKPQEAKLAAEDALHQDSRVSPAEDSGRAIQIEIDHSLANAEIPDFQLSGQVAVSSLGLTPTNLLHEDVSRGIVSEPSEIAIPPFRESVVAEVKQATSLPATTSKSDEVVPPSVQEAVVRSAPQGGTSEAKPATFLPSGFAIPAEAKVVPAPTVLPAPEKIRPDTQPVVSRSRTRVALAILILLMIPAAWIGLRSSGFWNHKPPEPSDRANPAQRPPMQQPAGTLANEEQLWQQAKGLLDQGRYTEAQQACKNILALPVGGIHRTEAQQCLDKTSLQLQAQNDLRSQAERSLAQGDFKSARHAAELLRQNGGNPGELLSKIDLEEQQQFQALKNQFDQLKQRHDPNAIRQLKVLQRRFQSIADSGGPLSDEALRYAQNVSAAIAKTRAGTKSVGPKCQALEERMELGEKLNEEELAYFNASCQ